ncbi:MAG: hypothetical protein HYT62_02105 [Candidatus Yanofskybacteria bacterium]|nr:hypothetical protein [Candidatus Yanofskybacteria bacterium]
MIKLQDMSNKEKSLYSEADAIAEAKKLSELVGDQATKEDYEEAEKIVDEESDKRLKQFLEIEGSLLEFSDTLLVGDEGYFIEASSEEKKKHADSIKNRDINGLHSLVHRMELWLYSRRRNENSEDYQKIDALQKKLKDWLDNK